MGKIKDYIILILLLLVIALSILIKYKDNNRPIVEPKVEYINDTIYINHIDTIYKQGETKVIYKEIEKLKYIVLNDSINYYQDSLVNNELKLYVNDTIKGRILNRNLNYTLLVPKEIIKTNTKVITNVKEIKNPYHNMVLFGLGYYPVNTRYYSLEYLKINNRLVYGGEINTLPGVQLKIGYKL